MQKPRAVEEFLRGIEPRYNLALQRLAAGNIDAECIFVIAGFVAYVMICSPAGLRILPAPFTSIIEQTGIELDSRGLMAIPPPSLAGESLTSLLNSEQVYVEIDPKGSQAMGITAIFSQVNTFGNFEWEILLNPFDDSTFFTSDFPVAIDVNGRRVR